ncbi:MAG: peptidoglycan binding domain-containing protein [Anaerolineales bacterium]|nr:peptidoglycan binding domain-containing protein [Anaerolineales bacterium]
MSKIPPPTMYRISPSIEPETKKPAPGWESCLNWTFLGIFLAGLALIPLVAAMGFLAYFHVFERIIPGVQVGETKLGGMSVYDASVKLHRDWNMERTILVGMMVGDEVKTWEIPMLELGISLDAHQTALNAYAIGHGAGMRSQALETLSGVLVGWEIPPVVAFDESIARVGLEALSTEITVRALDATILIEEDQIKEIPGVPGYTIDIDETINALSTNPMEVFLEGVATLSIKTLEPQIEDVSEVITEAERLLNASLRVQAYDPVSDERFDWQVPQAVVRSWVKIETSDQGLEVLIDGSKAVDYLLQLDEELGPERTIDGEKYAPILKESLLENTTATVSISYKPRTYVVQPGDSLLAIAWRTGIPMWKVIQANPGLDPDTILAGQELAIPPKDAMLTLPVIQNKRIKISISEQRLWTYQDGELLQEHLISTGLDRSPTQPGIFQVSLHDELAYASVWDLQMPHFIGIYESWPGFYNGLHALPILASGQRLWSGYLGQPVSYGCIVLDIQPAEEMFTWAEKGVVVEIVP